MIVEEVCPLGGLCAAIERARRTPPTPLQYVKVVMVFAVFVLAGCGASVSVHPFVDDGEYKTVWTKDWAPITRDARPWAPSSSSPGVCNKGGTKQGCYDVDERVASDLQQLLNDLRSTNVPSVFGDANAAIEQAIALDIDGLHQRDVGIAHNDDSAFKQAVDKLSRASALFGTAYAKYPEYDRPTPVPFGPSGYSG